MIIVGICVISGLISLLLISIYLLWELNYKEAPDELKEKNIDFPD